ncbi:MAG: prepilin-type N-terminal cleavage/methylation domain-containing protein [Patescibacteria group bacterium]
MIKKQNGFTLFELLVVISIIGVLVALGTVSYSNAQQKSRDSRAKSEIRAMGNAFEQYYNQNDTYAGCDVMAFDNWQGDYPPSDPRGRVSTDLLYSYYGTGGCLPASYCICAELEQTSGGNASDASCTWANGGGYFCVANQQ